MNRLSAISLFTGAGGLDLGFEAAGFTTAVAVEMDERCCETLRANRSWPVIEDDVGKVTSEKLLTEAGLAPGEADVLIGGPPCQPFSKSGFWVTGEAKRLDDPRATTIDHYLRILGDTRPRAFLLENVEGLGFRGKDEGLERIRSAVTTINVRHGTAYKPHVAVLNAADFGVPQVRRRLFVIAARDGSPFRYPEPTHVSPADARPGDNRPHWRTAWDALHDIDPPNDAALAVKGKWATLLPSIPEGQNYLHHTDRGAGEPLFGWRRRYWSFLLKLAKDQPAWTLQAQPGPATGPFHWSSRRLSMREMARLQSLPDDFDVIGTVIEAQKQLGNAVPSLLGEALARAIRMQLFGETLELDNPTLLRSAAAFTPPAEESQVVPRNFLALKGDHAPHPGTGLGFGAQSRASLPIAAE